MSNRNATVLASSTVAALLFAATLSLSAQTTSPQAADTQQQPSPTAQSPQDNSTYATGKPLPTKTNEGFWGHLNPLARKKWVNRQVGLARWPSAPPLESGAKRTENLEGS